MCMSGFFILKDFGPLHPYSSQKFNYFPHQYNPSTTILLPPSFLAYQKNQIVKAIAHPVPSHSQ